ncbi:MAG: phage tail protein [Nostoc sp.]|uniref:TipJ family phage tail tip protein n=1 Tax=Nostoc sp. TaxID=1180 RepID=UPI002FEED29D
MTKPRPSKKIQKLDVSGSGSLLGASGQTSNISGTSNDYVRGIAGLCEGMIEGLPNGAQDIQLNGTPVVNPDGSANFVDAIYFQPAFNWDIRLGTLDQTPFPDSLGETVIEDNVGVQCFSNTPVTRTVVNQNMNAIRIRVAVQLENTYNGNHSESDLAFTVDIQEGTGAFVNRLNTSIHGRFTDFTVFQYLFPVDETVNTYTIRLTNLSGNTTQDRTGNLQWLTISEVTQLGIAYLNTACVYYSFPSTLFSSDPGVSLLIAGKIFAIPTNAAIAPDRNDRGLNFSGAWNGLLYTPALATSDPAWAVYGIITAPRQNGGLGFDPSTVNIYDLYNCSVYNNQLVSDGFGGTERRYTFNGLITQQQPTLDTVRSICATFAAKPYWDGVQLCFWQERTGTALPRILCNADVSGGKFTPSSGEFQTISTVSNVYWSDPGNNYQSTPETVEVNDAIQTYGYISEDFTALGATTRGAAIRAGRRVIYSSLPKYAKQISFDCRPYSIFFKPGEIVQIADSGRGRQRKAGLIAAATSTSVTLDAETTISGNSGNYILVTLTDSAGNIYTEQSLITNPPGSNYTVINLATPLPTLPAIGANWQIVDGAVAINLYRIISIEPNTSDDNLFSIVAKYYDSNFENLIESFSNLSVLPSATTGAPTIMEPPVGLTVTLTQPSYFLDSHWTQPVRVDGSLESYTSYYIAEYKQDSGGQWGNRITNSQPYASWNVSGLSTDTWFVRVAAVATNGVVSQWITVQATIIVTPPAH